ncbi:MAG TPA: phosphoenolpyruvate--protein phosphotransferase [Alphaproteobacteria bacterium]|nr:phosphoenolpyruvate--protein phosphotransferase [Alphaproteobacteria bacterium]
MDARSTDERILPGKIASPGLATGAIALQTADRSADRVSRPAGDERAALAAAIAEAAAQLNDLAARSDAGAGEILEFQIALLEDEALTEPALERIDEGETAAAGWRAVLDAQIAEYETADREYFRARAVDLGGLRDRVLRLLAGGDERRSSVPAGSIIVADGLTTSGFLEIDWTRIRGAVLVGDSPSSHVAMLARARGVPLLVGLGVEIDKIHDGAPAILDAEGGRLILNPEAATRGDFDRLLADRAARQVEEAAYLRRPARTASGEPVTVMVNVDDPALLDGTDPADCDGIGLARTEFLFRGEDGPPDEDTQYAAYRRLIAWAAGRPVTVRTFDIGGDKPIAGLTVVGEPNPALGVRGVRLSLSRPEVLKVQLRALARAAARGPIRAMIPMVTVPEEMAAVRRLLDEVLSELAADGRKAAPPPLGMMVEVPAAALAIDRFRPDFLSIGSNDLVQYVTATSRDDGRLARLHDPLNPGVLELVRRVAAYGRASGMEVYLCGDMAADPAYLPALFDAGVRSVSVSAAALARTKAAIARYAGGRA